MKIKTNIKAGPRNPDDPDRATWINNHNETQARSRGLTVKTGIKAGPRTGDTLTHEVGHWLG